MALRNDLNSYPCELRVVTLRDRSNVSPSSRLMMTWCE
jgi:hypothetical protein